MTIDAIKNGIVIDHIKAGRAMEIYEALGLADLDCSVAIIKNVVSKKSARKDIIKIDADIPVNLEVLGYIDPDITINIIKDGRVAEKKHIELPKKIYGILRCKNPRCITTVEQELPQIFKLTDPEKRTYRCIYCESKVK